MRTREVESMPSLYKDKGPYASKQVVSCVLRLVPRLTRAFWQQHETPNMDPDCL